MYHVTEPEVKEAADPAVYADQVEMMEIALETQAIGQAVRSVRERLQQAGE